jgi:hypothetical protein
MLTKSLFTRLALCFLTASFFSLQAAETRGFDVGVLANGFNVIRGDATPLASGYGAGALVNWQWSADWRAGFQMGCAHVCAGNLEVGYRAHTFDYSRFRYPERAIYYIIGFGTKEVWLRFVTGINAVKGLQRAARPRRGLQPACVSGGQFSPGLWAKFLYGEPVYDIRAGSTLCCSGVSVVAS